MYSKDNDKYVSHLNFDLLIPILNLIKTFHPKFVFFFQYGSQMMFLACRNILWSLMNFHVEYELRNAIFLFSALGVLL